MSSIQPGIGASPESRPAPPPDKEKKAKKGEASGAAQPQVQEPPPQAPALRVESVQVQPEVHPQAVAQAPTEGAPSLDPDQAEVEVAKLVISKPKTAGDLDNFAKELERTTPRT